MQERRRFKQEISLRDRLSAFISAMRERAEMAPPGPERDELLKKARNAETAVEIDGWANSNELRPPK
jgi:hypothetical protein